MFSTYGNKCFKELDIKISGFALSRPFISYILSMAMNYHPYEVSFVLIDYKGGGLTGAFENKETGMKLPHLAGTITNLDKSAINRSIASLESELKRRQSIFNDAREKLKEGQMDIYKYQQHYRKGHVDLPLSHLLIICDEFGFEIDNCHEINVLNPNENVFIVAYERYMVNVYDK